MLENPKAVFYLYRKNMEDVMGDHAGNFLDNDNYVAGLVDSDFSVMIVNRVVRGDKIRMAPKINFTNTNSLLTDFMSSYLKKYGINHHVGIRNKTVSHHKMEKQLTITRYSKCIDFSERIFRCSIIRRPQLEIVRDFCIDRCKYVEESGWKFINTPYTDYQKELCDKIRKCNLNYNFDNGYRNYTFSWLGGFIDGDGSIGLSYCKQGNDRLDYRISPFINFSFGSDTGLNNTIELFNKYGITHKCSKFKCKASEKADNKNKYYYLLVVTAHEDLRRLVLNLNGKLLAKQKQLDLVSEFLDIRSVEHNGYSDRCYELVNQCKDLNNNYI